MSLAISWLRHALAVLLAISGHARAANGVALTATTTEPRAFGYQVGDVVQRRVTVQVPAGLSLDTSTLPRPGARGSALELRAVERKVQAAAGGQREEILLEYQVFLSPPAVRTLEMPSFTLRFEGTPRAEALRVDAWPVSVAPLVPTAVSPRRGLGELQPDVAPPLIDTNTLRQRLAASAALAMLALLYLTALYVAVPWWQRSRRPFARAWRQIGRLPDAANEDAWRDACKQMHKALDATAGEVLFERGVPVFLQRRPAFAALTDDIHRFLQLSRREFFAGGARDAGAATWLREFSRRCRNAERNA